MTRVIASHQPPCRPPISLRAGDTVNVGRRDDEWPAFVLCSCALGEGWVPEEYLDGTRSPARLKRDYTTRELAPTPGEEVNVIERCGGWVFCEYGNSKGWIPERCLDG